MPRRTLEIVNKLGLHARAAAQFVKVAGAFGATVSVEKDGQSVDGKSIMGLMMLAAGSCVISPSSASASLMRCASVSLSGNCEMMRPEREMSRVSTLTPAWAAKACTMGSRE